MREFKCFFKQLFSSTDSSCIYIGGRLLSGKFMRLGFFANYFGVYDVYEVSLCERWCIVGCAAFKSLSNTRELRIRLMLD